MKHFKRDYNWRLHQQNKHIKRRILTLECRHSFYNDIWNDIIIYGNKYWVHNIGTYTEYKYRTSFSYSKPKRFSYYYKYIRAQYKKAERNFIKEYNYE